MVVGGRYKEVFPRRGTQAGRGVEEKQARPLAKGRGTFPDEGRVGRRRLRRSPEHLAGLPLICAGPELRLAVATLVGAGGKGGQVLAGPGPRGAMAGAWIGSGVPWSAVSRREARGRAVPRQALPP